MRWLRMVCCYGCSNPLSTTMEDTKNKDAKKDKESPELKEELSEEDLEGISGGSSEDLEIPLQVWGPYGSD